MSRRPPVSPLVGGDSPCFGCWQGGSVVLGAMGVLPMGLGAALCMEGGKERSFSPPLAMMGWLCRR